MSKQTLSTSEEQVNQITGWQRILVRVMYVLLIGLLILVAWLYTFKILPGVGSSAGWVVGTGLIFAALAVACERLLGSFRLRLDWRYRLAFFIPAGIGIIVWLGSFGLRSGLMNWLWLVVAVCGVFLGCLVATSLNEGIWENNSPPSKRLEEEVLQVHRKVIGQPGSTPRLKRIFDIILALSGILLASPVWLVSILLIWLENPGPLLFVKNSVGKGGVNFHQFKLRTMVRGAEDSTGPVLASEADERVLLAGRVLRKTALDELPQLINILGGEMSFVGPRPQRTVLVHGYLETMPEYAERHRVLPGLAGLAQVAGDYYLTPRQKLRFDRLYIQHTGLGFDLKLLYLAFLITFWYRWQKDWNGRLPRKLLHTDYAKQDT